MQTTKTDLFRPLFTAFAEVRRLKLFSLRRRAEN